MALTEIERQTIKNLGKKFFTEMPDWASKENNPPDLRERGIDPQYRKDVLEYFNRRLRIKPEPKKIRFRGKFPA